MAEQLLLAPLDSSRLQFERAEQRSAASDRLALFLAFHLVADSRRARKVARFRGSRMLAYALATYELLISAPVNNAI